MMNNSTATQARAGEKLSDRTTRVAVMPITGSEDVPEALRQRVAAHFVRTVEVSELLDGLLLDHKQMVGAIEILSDWAEDDRPLELEEATGMGTVHALLLDMAAKIEHQTACQSEEMAAEYQMRPWTAWPDTAWPLPDMEGVRNAVWAQMWSDRTGIAVEEVAS